MSDTTKQMLMNFLQGQGKIWGAMLSSYLVTHHVIDSSMSGQFTMMFVGGLIYACVSFWSWWNASGHALLATRLKKVTGQANLNDAGKVADALPSTPSPQVQAVAAAVVKASAVLALCVLVLSAFSGQASAATKLTGNAVKDFGPQAVSSLIPADPFQDLMTKMEAVKKDVIAGIISALQEADADAGTVVNTSTGDVKDPISHACYPAQVKFLQSLPSAQPIDSPAPYSGIVVFQRKRDFIAQVRAGLPVYLKLGCAPLLGDEVQTFIQIMGMVGVKVLPAAATAMFPALAPVTLPAMILSQ